MSTEQSSYDSNMKKFGWADYAKPASIDIYPKDFESKQSVIDILDNYNEAMNAAGEEDKVVSYTDIVGALMSSVTTIVNMISYVLMAFVAISLVVSSIMIGIITYISVLERKKEIGVFALHWRKQRRYQPRVQRRNHHRRFRSRRYWHRTYGFGLHSRQHDCLFIVRCGKHRDSAMASRDCLDWHKRTAHILGRPHSFKRSGEKRPGRSSEKRIRKRRGLP